VVRIRNEVVRIRNEVVRIRNRHLGKPAPRAARSAKKALKQY